MERRTSNKTDGSLHGKPNRSNSIFYLSCSRKTIRGLFEPSLEGVKDVLENQLELAESQGFGVQKVILTGGFGQSPSLRSYLETYLSKRMNINGWKMDLVVPRNPSVVLTNSACFRKTINALTDLQQWLEVQFFER